MIIRRIPRGVTVLLAAGGLVLAGLGSLGGQAEAGASTSAAAASCVAGADHHRVRAGTAPTADPNAISPARVEKLNARLATRVRQLPPLDRYQLLRPTKITTIQVYVNVIYDPGIRGSRLSDSIILRQIEVLNAAYRSSFFRFELAENTPRASARYYNWPVSSTDTEAPRAQAAKTAYHRGTAADLNIYFARLSDYVLGYATFPGGSTTLDGVVLDIGTPPGGGAANYNEGDTAVHEVGHWLGLYHTFQDGCSFLNDGIADTPAQSDEDPAALGCRAKDTCPTYPGNDPLTNFMSYSQDSCMTSFTKNQGFRMRQVWATSRAPSQS